MSCAFAVPSILLSSPDNNLEWITASAYTGTVPLTPVGITQDTEPPPQFHRRNGLCHGGGVLSSKGKQGASRPIPPDTSPTRDKNPISPLLNPRCSSNNNGSNKSLLSGAVMSR